MENRYKLIEDALLMEADLQIERAESQGEKSICELFKSALLKKYKDSYDSDLQRGEVNKETVDKCIDFLFANACVSFRTIPNVDESTKEDVIGQARKSLVFWKAMVKQMLLEKGVRVL